MQKVKYLCSQINKVEWSGVLFYSVEGTIRDPSNLILTAEDIFLMDKGSSGYTNYSFNDPKLAEYVMSDNYNMNWKMGHIHSHHSMQTFFSGTDTDEINENSEFHNYYLSLIVNNFMDKVAKIAFRGEIPTQEFNYAARDENGEFYPLPASARARSKVFVMDCAIEVADASVEVPDSFKERTAEIITAKDEKEQTRNSEYYFGKEDDKAPFVQRGYTNGWDGYRPSGYKAPTLFSQETEEEELSTEDFLAYVLRMGSIPEHCKTLDPLQNVDAAICDLVEKKADIKVLATYITNNMGELYRRYFNAPITTSKGFYKSTLCDCLEILEEYATQEPKYKPLLPAFVRMIKAVDKSMNTNGTGSNRK